MAWNPYTDWQNRGYVSILTTLFPEQTKTLPRIIVWSIIFLIDLTVGIFGAYHLGFFQFEKYSNTSQTALASILLILGIIFVFWLQGVLWGAVAKLFRRTYGKDAV